MIDTHAHLDFPDFDADRDAVVARAREGRVFPLITIGTDLEGCRRALRLAERYEGVFTGLGIHPNHTRDVPETDWRAFEALFADPAVRPRVLAVGETGLDFYRDHSPRAVQEAAFRRQIRLARRHALPVVVHCRDAYARCAEVLEEEIARDGRVSGVMHCFAGTLDDARRCLALGFHLSFAGPLTYKKNDALREVAREAPIDRLLVETDCPFLPPEPHRGKRNEPLYTRLTAEALARTRGVAIEAIEAATDRNARALFGLPAAEAGA
jgi:TatD DNase family protein